MIRIVGASGKPEFVPRQFAELAVRRFRLRRHRIAPDEMERLKEATLRETPPEEVERRWRERKQILGR